MTARWGLIVALGLCAPSSAQAYEFLCRGWQITGVAGNGCPSGNQDSDSCGCAPSQPSTAPKWYGAMISYSVENQGGNGVSASQFVAASRRAAASWTNVSCSTLAVQVPTTLAAGSSARFGNHGNIQSEHGKIGRAHV